MLRTGLELEKIETYVLKVNINCEGCKQRVKKLLRKIEGVFSVHIDEEHQVVKVTGKVDPSKLVKKLIKSGKHAEFFEFIKGDHKNKNQMQNLRNHGIDHDSQMKHHGRAYGYELEDHDHYLGNYLNHNNGKFSMTSEADHQNLIQETNLHSRHMGQDENEDRFANNGYMLSMMNDHGATFGDIEGAGFVGLRRQEFGMFHEVPSRLPNYYEYNHSNFPSMNKTNLHNYGYHLNNPSAPMNIYMLQRQSNNNNMMIRNDNNYMHHQDDMLSYLSPLTYSPYNISYVPHY